MTTRFLSVNDIDSIIELENGFNDGWSREMIKSSLDSGLYYAIGLFNDSELISYISFSISIDIADIDMIYTRKEYRHQGLAEKLIIKAIEFLKEKNIKEIFLEVREQNEIAKALYNKCGFSKVSIRKQYYADGENALILKREI